MHILVDLQALQTAGSRHRGIGRYSLALFRAMAAANRPVRLSALLNGRMLESCEEVRSLIADVIDPRDIHVFDTPGRTALIEPANAWRARASAALVELKAEAIGADFVHVASLFENFVDDSISTISKAQRGWSATLYDLIPWYQRAAYLQDPELRRCYMTKLDLARHAELLFAISESARQEAIETLELPGDRVVNIRGDVDPLFSVARVPDDRSRSLRARFGIEREFVMYTAGIDRRKNIERLIEAYAGLPAAIRRLHQLVIVCTAKPAELEALRQCAHAVGLGDDELVCTGFVADADLADLYRLCRLFAFPSLHEGFGMPILEAMRCGAPVIGSDTSSMPEILGSAEAQFDPRSTASISDRIAHALSDPAFRARLVDNSHRQQALFSWSDTASRVLDAFASRHGRREPERSPTSRPSAKPRLAFVSPLSPEQSGIADYSSELIPALSRHYDITLVTDLPRVDHPWLDGIYPLCSLQRFERQAASFDRIVYQVGNSAEFHADALRLVPQRPGVVVLHDFFLCNLFDYLDLHGGRDGILRAELLRSHGYGPLLAMRDGASRGFDTARSRVLTRYPASRLPFEYGFGTIVHSTFAERAAERFYGVEGPHAIVRIEHLRAKPQRSSRAAARRALDLPDDAVVVCSFGLIGSTKCNAELVRAWCSSELAARPDHVLVFVGPVSDGPYDSAMRDAIAKAGLVERIRFTGYADADTFQRYLDAADCAVQLRTGSRGETSGAALHCLAHGLPVVVNRHGTLAELPDDAALSIPERFTDAELVAAILSMTEPSAERTARIERGLAYISDDCAPATIAAEYHEAIERFYATHGNRRLDRFLADLVRTPGSNRAEGDLEQVASIASATLAPQRLKHCLVDVTEAVVDFERTDARSDATPELRSLLEALIDQAGPTVRIEPVYWDGDRYRHACHATLGILGLEPIASIEDEVVEVRFGDVLQIVGHDTWSAERTRWLRRRRLDGLRTIVLAGSFPSSVDPSSPMPSLLARFVDDIVVASDGAVASARRHLDEFADIERADTLRLHAPNDAEARGNHRPVGASMAHVAACASLVARLVAAPESVVPVASWGGSGRGASKRVAGSESDLAVVPIAA